MVKHNVDCASKSVASVVVPWHCQHAWHTGQESCHDYSQPSSICFGTSLVTISPHLVSQDNCQILHINVTRSISQLEDWFFDDMPLEVIKVLNKARKPSARWSYLLKWKRCSVSDPCLWVTMALVLLFLHDFNLASVVTLCFIPEDVYCITSAFHIYVFMWIYTLPFLGLFTSVLKVSYSKLKTLTKYQQTVKITI